MKPDADHNWNKLIKDLMTEDKDYDPWGERQLHTKALLIQQDLLKSQLEDITMKKKTKKIWPLINAWLPWVTLAIFIGGSLVIVYYIL